MSVTMIDSSALRRGDLPNNSIVYRISGGLGNQLFQVACGVALQARFARPLVFDYLERWNAYDASYNPAGKPEFLKLVNTVDAVIVSTTQIKNQATISAERNRLFGTNSSLHYSDSSGSIVSAEDSPVQIHGFDCSREVVEELISNYIDPSWYSNDKALPKDHISIHVRLGDFRDYPRFGSIGRTYLRAALGIVAQANKITKLTLFSDSPDEAVKLFCAQDRTRLDFFFGSPAESLGAMSSHQALILSPSTFSLWAGYLSRSSSVVYPVPFYSRAQWDHYYIPNWWKGAGRGFENQVKNYIEAFWQDAVKPRLRIGAAV